MSDLPRGVWALARTPLLQPYPCRCDRRCDPNWCPCAGRTDLHAVPTSCCASRNTPDVVARAKHGGDYRTCWCKGHIELHKDMTRPVQPIGLRDTEDDEEDEDS